MIPVLILTALIFSGCISTDHLFLGQERAPAKPPSAPIVFLTDPPTMPFVKLAIVEATGRSSTTEWEELREALTEEARAIGADAIMDMNMGNSGLSGGSFRGTGGVGTRRVLTGTAIRWTTAPRPNP